MFSTPIPRASFLDSTLRVRGHLNRRLTHAQAIGPSHLGHGLKPAPDRPALPPTSGDALGATEPTP